MYPVKRTTTFLISIALVALAAGCGRARFPDVEIEPVKTFSLGSAKITPFKTRPTAEQLYKTTLRLYDSFESVAVTDEVRGQLANEWTEVDGRAKNIKVQKYHAVNERRAIIPDKILETNQGKDTLVMVRNGNTYIHYYSSLGQYTMSKTSEDFLNPAALWAGLLPPTGEFARPFSSIKLLPDSKINGTEVYVLELKLKAKKVRHGLSPAETTTVYLGKNDLLPRRAISVQDRTGSSAKLKGLPSNTSTSEYLGFVANSKLPEALFPTKPPKGAKPMKGDIVVD